MNQITISIVVIGVVVLGGYIFYSVGNTMMFGNDFAEMRDHSDKLDDIEISPGEVVTKMRSNMEVIILDVRALEEYEALHLENALLLPVQEMSQQSLNKIGIGQNKKDTEIIIYGRSGSRSKTAYNIMKSLGYTNLKSVAGGMVHWKEDEYPMTQTGAYTGPQVILKDTKTISSTDSPKISIDRTIHDFGVIPQYGGSVETTFTLSNKGVSVLDIGDITTSCSCTTAVISNSSINPGDTATLTVTLDPNLHEEPNGVFTRTVFIPTNDSDTPEAEVTIQVDIAEGE